MTVQYNSQKPIFPSSFLEDVSNPPEHYKVVFLGNGMENNKPVDLYFVQYANGNINAIYQYGEDPGAYGSGDTIMFNDLIKGKKSAQTEIYKRAVKAGYLKEETIYIGYSKTFEEEAAESYYGSYYFESRPLHRLMGDDELEELTEAEEDAYEQDFAEKVAAYDKNYIETVGPIPENLTEKNYHIFKDLDEARKYCSDNNGLFKKYTTISDKHTEYIGRSEQFCTTYLYDKQRRERDVRNNNEMSI